MTQLAYGRAFAPRFTFVDELKMMFSATPLSILVAALKARR
jgi:hypothetical protein